MASFTSFAFCIKDRDWKERNISVGSIDKCLCRLYFHVNCLFHKAVFFTETTGRDKLLPLLVELIRFGDMIHATKAPVDYYDKVCTFITSSCIRFVDVLKWVVLQEDGMLSDNVSSITIYKSVIADLWLILKLLFDRNHSYQVDSLGTCDKLDELETNVQTTKISSSRPPIEKIDNWYKHKSVSKDLPAQPSDEKLEMWYRSQSQNNILRAENTALVSELKRLQNNLGVDPMCSAPSPHRNGDPNKRSEEELPSRNLIV